MLHLPTNIEANSFSQANTSSNKETSNQESLVGLNSSRGSKSSPLLPTAIVYVFKNNGEKLTCRSLLDSASQSNFLTQRLYNKLGIKGRKVGLPTTGINNSESRGLYKIKVKIQSMQNLFYCNLPCLVLAEITQCLPQISFNKEDIHIPVNHIEI